jgi:hypothetical protein
MPSPLYPAIGFLISLAGAVVIAWPIVTRTETQLTDGRGFVQARARRAKPSGRGISLSALRVKSIGTAPNRMLP